MDRHQFMIDFLRTELTIEDQVRTFSYKRELTKEDYDLIIKNISVVKKAAKIAKDKLCSK